MLVCLSARARMPHALRSFAPFLTTRFHVTAEMNQPVSASGRRVWVHAGTHARAQLAHGSVFSLGFQFYLILLC